MAGGVIAIAHSYEVAETTIATPSEFVWFWFGMFLVALPLTAVIARRRTPAHVRSALIVLYGLVSYAPKLLRTPSGPVYGDEYAHWRAAYNILNTGKLFSPDPLSSIISQYPGLEAATAALVHATGLTIWQAGTLLLIICHATLLIGVAVLAQTLGFDNRTACLVAILYSLNSSFLYFDTEYSYESMAITLAVWALVAFVLAVRSRPGAGRAAWCVLTVAISAGTVATHHLSTLTLVMIMGLISLALTTPWLARTDGWSGTSATAWSLTLITTVMAGSWFHFVAPGTFSYLSPYLDEGLSELVQAARGAGGARHLFGTSLSPWWEEESAYLVIVFALVMAIVGLFLLRAQIRERSLPRGSSRSIIVAFAVFGLVYFPSTLLILSPNGAEGARRSWAFTWIGLSILAGPAAVWILDRARRSIHRWSRVIIRSALTATLGITLVGSTATGVDVAYRFPGPFLYGSDARSVTPELLATARWFLAKFGAGNNIVTDRYTGLVLGSVALQNPGAPSTGFPTWDLYLAKPGSQIEPNFLLFELGLSNYAYLIVDERMAYDVPEIGFYFTPSDPPTVLPENGKSPFSGRLAKFDTLYWAIKVYQSNNYAIYRMNLPPGGAGYQLQPPTHLGKPLQGKLSISR